MLTNWGVFWRTFLLVHFLFALWLGYANRRIPSSPAYPANPGIGAAGQYFLLCGPASLVPVGLLHLGVGWAYARRPYRLRRALWLSLGLGSVLPGLGAGASLALKLADHQPGPYFAYAGTLTYWAGVCLLLGLGFMLVLPHWLFFQRLPAQRALRQAAAAQEQE